MLKLDYFSNMFMLVNFYLVFLNKYFLHLNILWRHINEIQSHASTLEDPDQLTDLFNLCFSSMLLSIHFFLQQIFTKYLPCATHYIRWEYLVDDDDDDDDMFWARHCISTLQFLLSWSLQTSRKETTNKLIIVIINTKKESCKS